MGHRVTIRGDHVAAALEARSREPFTDVLAQFMVAMPDPEAIKAFADKHPDRWAHAVATFGRLAGYHDKLRVDTSVAGAVSRMSDMELMQRLAEVQARLPGQGTKRTATSNRASPRERAGK